MRFLKKLNLAVAISLIVSMIVGAVCLADSSWEYRFPISMTDNTSAARTYYPAMLGFGGSQLVTSGKISANGTDTNMQIGNDNIKYMLSTTNCTAVIPSIPANGKVTTNLYTGYSPVQTSFSIIVGDSGNVTTDDAAGIEMSDNGTITLTNWYPLDGTNFSKEDAIAGVYDEATENFTVGIYEDIGYYEADAASWTDGANAVDGDTGTYAYANLPSGGWTTYCTFTITEFNASKLKYWYTSVTRAPDNIEIDVYDGSWTNIYSGAVGGSGGFIEKTFTAANITQFRMKFEDTDDTGDGVVRLHEAPVYGRHIAYDTSVTATSVDQDEHDIEFSINSPFLSTGIDTTSPITPSSVNLTYNLPFRQEHFDTSGANFTSLDTFQHECDPVNVVWSSGGYSFDGTGDYVSLPSSTINSTQGTFIIWIKFSRSDTNEYFFGQGNGELDIYHNSANELRLYYDGVTEINTNLLTAYGAYVDEWLHLAISYKDGGHGYCYINGNQVTDDPSINPGGFTPGTTKIGSYSNGNTAFKGDMGEFLYYDEQLPESLIDRHYNATRAHFTTGSIFTTSAADISIPDTANDYVFKNFAYCDSIELAIGGTRQVYYAPIEMLTGATLEDRENAYDGIISWGSNTGLELVYGEMVASEDYESGAGGTGGFDMPDAVMPSTWFAMGEDLDELPAYDMIYEVAGQLGYPDVDEGVQSLYFIIIVGIALFAFLLMVLYTRSVLVGFAAFNIILFIGSSMTIVPMWIPFTTVLTGIAIMFLYKQVAY